MKNQRIRVLVILSTLVIALLLSGFLYASEGEEGHEEGIFSIIGKWFNFIALIGILYLFFTRVINLPEKFRETSEEIQKSVEGARLAKEEAEARLKEMDHRMLQVNEEIAAIRENAEREAEQEKKRILDAAQKEAARIVDLAHREIESEIRMARKALRSRVGDQAIDQSKTIIEEEMSEEDHTRMMDRYIKEFGK